RGVAPLPAVPPPRPQPVLLHGTPHHACRRAERTAARPIATSTTSATATQITVVPTPIVRIPVTIPTAAGVSRTPIGNQPVQRLVANAEVGRDGDHRQPDGHDERGPAIVAGERSEERRVGKECRCR